MILIPVNKRPSGFQLPEGFPFGLGLVITPTSPNTDHH